MFDRSVLYNRCERACTPIIDEYDGDRVTARQYVILYKNVYADEEIVDSIRAYLKLKMLLWKATISSRCAILKHPLFQVCDPCNKCTINLQ